MRPPNVILVEDEELARNRLARLVGEHAEFNLTAACANCEEAMQVMTSHMVDIALLDIQMPGMGGIRFLNQLKASGTQPPIVVFITAHKRFVFDAFDMSAADYLLKPFDHARLQRALCAAKERFLQREAMHLVEKLQSVVSDTNSSPAVVESKTHATGRFLVRDNGRFFIVRDDQVDWIEADGRECILHCGAKKHHVAGPLADLAARLCVDHFVQVNRSSLVNIDSIAELEEMFKGDLIAVMKNGQSVAVSRRFRPHVMERLAG
jgi:two-component system, LytTR family, response regulator